MRIIFWDFNPSLWPTLAVLLILPLFLSLGFWQLDRAEQKRTLHKEFKYRQSAEAIDLNEERNAKDSLETLLWHKVTIDGEFSRDANVLLDNQVISGKAGYFVYTPFKFKNEESWILVNRGWVPAGARRDDPPGLVVEKGVLKIVGSIKSPPSTGMLLAENLAEQLGDGTIRVQKLELVAIENVLKFELLPYVVRLEPESAGGFTKHWKAPGSGEEKHLGYAFQWFAMAGAICIIYLILNFKRVK
jgi:surfeit locus 1 family protein